MDRRSRILGALLGVAIGDAAGLPFEGLPQQRVTRRFERADRFRLVGRTGFVSDDTEQTALLAQALAFAGTDDAACIRAFRKSMVGWFARLPFGIGGATLRACVRMLLGMTRSGIASAGNGAAMRAGILGAHLADDPRRRRTLGRLIAQLTHTDERAVQAALYVAELSAQCVAAPTSNRKQLVSVARQVVDEPQLQSAIEAATAMSPHVDLSHASSELGNSGFVVHSMGLCTYCFLSFPAAQNRRPCLAAASHRRRSPERTLP